MLPCRAQDAAALSQAQSELSSLRAEQGVIQAAAASQVHLVEAEAQKARGARQSAEHAGREVAEMRRVVTDLQAEISTLQSRWGGRSGGGG